MPAKPKTKKKSTLNYYEETEFDYTGWDDNAYVMDTPYLGLGWLEMDDVETKACSALIKYIVKEQMDDVDSLSRLIRIGLTGRIPKGWDLPELVEDSIDLNG